MNKKKDEEKKGRYHSEIEETLVKDILKVDLKESSEELDKRIVVQHTDRMVNIDCFNAYARKVIIKDENGKRILIDNHDQIKKQQLKNAGKLNPPPATDINQNDNVTIDDVEFD